jgi:triacylglycerol esterase/lipase EstA (alpha/beta hydrolase family)
LYPSWSPACPLHFLGHSMGGPTITAMLMLIREGFFDNNASAMGTPVDDSMVASVTAVSAPFRGTGIVYRPGETTDAAPTALQLSVRIFFFVATTNHPSYPYTHFN